MSHENVLSRSQAPATSEELAGDINPLTQALGTTAALDSLSSLARLVNGPAPETLGALRTLLARYRERLLTPIELPAIRDAYHHTARGEVRELLDLDRRIAREYGDSAFAEVSRHTGRTQLRRLRPLRDTTLQRYLQAVDAGEAMGSHVVVFGLLLAIFSLPLHQGLAQYASKTQQSLVDSAMLALPATEPERERLRAECDAPIAPAVRSVLPAFTPTFV